MKRKTVLQKRVGIRRRKCITSLVIAVTVMPLYPHEINLVLLCKSIEPLPEVRVLKLVLTSSPAVRAPRLNPAEKKGIYEILGI